MISPTPSSLLGARSNSLLTSYQIMAELVGCKSMSEAAWNLDLDVSVVSRHVAAMEQAFGCTLFDRHGRGVRLTVAGQAVADYVASVLQAEARVRQELSEIQDLRRGTLRIIGTDGAIAGPIAQAVSRFSRQHSGLQFELYRSSSELIATAVKDGRADVGAGLNLEVEPGVDVVATLADDLVAVMRPDHPLAGRRRVALAECCRYPLGTFERNSGVGRALQRIVKAEETTVSAALVTNALDALKHFCAADQNISILCRHSVGAELGNSTLIAVPLSCADSPVTMRLDICVASNPVRSLALTGFLRCLGEQCGFGPTGKRQAG